MIKVKRLVSQIILKSLGAIKHDIILVAKLTFVCRIIAQQNVEIGLSNS